MASLDENPNCARSYAAFRLIGDALEPDAVSRMLNLEPTFAFAKGQEIPPGRIGKARRQRTGIWSLSSENAVNSTNLERHLIHLLEAIEPAAAALAEVLSTAMLRADFFCYWRSASGHGGPEISPETLGRIATVGASLGIDFYGQATNRTDAAAYR